MPADIKNALNTRVVRVLKSSEMSQRIDEQGWRVLATTPEAFGAIIKDDNQYFKELLKELGIDK